VAQGALFSFAVFLNVRFKGIFIRAYFSWLFSIDFFIIELKIFNKSIKAFSHVNE
jgi:hypothetical protein